MLRRLSTAAASATAKPAKRNLKNGPSFHEFLAEGQGDKPLTLEESLELSPSSKQTAINVQPLTKKKHQKLPSWIKTDIPTGEVFKKIKRDY